MNKFMWQSLTITEYLVILVKAVKAVMVETKTYSNIYRINSHYQIIFVFQFFIFIETQFLNAAY